MKCWIILFILLFPIALAQPTLKFQHEEIQPGETIFATVETAGEFTKSILDSDINFYEGRKDVFIEHGVHFYNGKHYLYAYPTREGNFTIQIKDVLYKESGQLKSMTLEKEFVVLKLANSSILSIKPGVVFTSSEPKLKLTNQGESSLNVTVDNKAFSLNAARSYELLLAPTETFSLLVVSAYKDFQVPVIFLGTNGSQNQTSTKADLRADPSLLSFNLSVGSSSQSILSLYNFGEDNLTDLQSLTTLNFFKISKLNNIPPRGILNLTLTLSPENVGYFSDNFTITYEQGGSKRQLVIPITVYTLPKDIPANNFSVSAETCEGLKGVVCTSNQLCDGEKTFAKDGAYCCLGSCVDNKSASSDSGFGWIIGILILITLGLVGYYLYTKQKKFAPQTPQQTIAKSAENYSKRISGGVQRS